MGGMWCTFHLAFYLQSFDFFNRLPIHALGSSLADVAAFMQEVELDFGMNPTSGEDRRGIDRLRVLARQLQNQPIEELELEDRDEDHTTR
jgi:hypothetical protein